MSDLSGIFSVFFSLECPVLGEACHLSRELRSKPVIQGAPVCFLLQKIPWGADKWGLIARTITEHPSYESLGPLHVLSQEALGIGFGQPSILFVRCPKESLSGEWDSSDCQTARLGAGFGFFQVRLLAPKGTESAVASFRDEAWHVLKPSVGAVFFPEFAPPFFFGGGPFCLPLTRQQLLFFAGVLIPAKRSGRRMEAKPFPAGFSDVQVRNVNALGRILNMVQHPSIAPPFLTAETRVDCNGRRGFTQRERGCWEAVWEDGSVQFPVARTQAGEKDARCMTGGDDDVFSYEVKPEDPHGWVPRLIESHCCHRPRIDGSSSSLALSLPHSLTLFSPFSLSLFLSLPLSRKFNRSGPDAAQETAASQVCAYTPSEGLLVGYVWPREDYPWVSLWCSGPASSPRARREAVWLPGQRHPPHPRHGRRHSVLQTQVQKTSMNEGQNVAPYSSPFQFAKVGERCAALSEGLLFPLGCLSKLQHICYSVALFVVPTDTVQCIHQTPINPVAKPEANPQPAQPTLTKAIGCGGFGGYLRTKKQVQGKKGVLRVPTGQY